MRTERTRRRILRRLCRVILLLAPIMVAQPGLGFAQGIGRSELGEVLDWGRGSLILFDRLEYAPVPDGRPLALDLTAWYGGAYNRVWLRADAELQTSDGEGDVETQLLYGRLVTPFWDALVGGRIDRAIGDEEGTRALLAVGVTGLSPLRFELSPTLFLSPDGDLSARLEAEYQVLITQRLVAEPEFELNAALQEVPEWGVGRGLNDLELGLRLRYELAREFAPYIGYSWLRRMGAAAEFAGEEGASASTGAFIAGLRLWR